MSVYEISEKIYMALKLSVAITLSTNVDLAIKRLGVRVASTVVKMMKRKFATSGISNVGCAIPSPTRGVAQPRSATMSNATLFCGTTCSNANALGRRSSAHD